MHLSNHLTLRSMASRMRFVSGEVVTRTSSSCMMISLPIVFWSVIECSGVRSMGEPSWGERKRTPSSVMVASLRRETIWKLGWLGHVSWCFEIQYGRREDIPPAVGQNVVFPSLEFMRSSYFRDDFLPGLQSQMVCVIQT
jgi:hypothetical protein